MRTVHIQPLTHEAFAPFGRFYPMEQPQGYALCGELHRFFPDRLSADRHARKPLVERSVERERERASADREAGRDQATDRGGKPMRRRDYERAVEHEERSRYMEQEQEPERDRDWW